GSRLFRVNGKPILIRGAGWSQDMLLRTDEHRLRDQFRLVEDMNLNTIRLEGKLETEEFFHLADRDGILVMLGWCCCDHWERWKDWTKEDLTIATASLRSQMLRLRHHASLLVWLNGSDNAPPTNVERAYLDVEAETRWPNPILSAASSQVTAGGGLNGAKMTGPYDYVAPSYWYVDKQNGGAYGFNTETSPGPAIPSLASREKFLPDAQAWPPTATWSYHFGGGEFKDLKVFDAAMDAIYAKPQSAAEYERIAQTMEYDSERAMYEAYSRNNYASTGVIQWMLNNAWPSMIWHLYDYYLRPGGGYFGAKKAMQALDPVYGYDDHSVWLVSSQYADAKGLKLSARVFNLDGTQKFYKDTALDAASDSTAKVFEIPQIEGLSPAYFLDLRVTDGSGKLVGSNFYWLSTKPETLDWAKSNWYMTPTESYADYTSLAQLPKVKLKVSSRSGRSGENEVTRVAVENPSKNLAFFVRLKLKGKSGEEILPVVWQDNYISLLPGEKREISATYRASSMGTATPAIEVSGWNVE
ncbi:MAG: glycoside hydrolase family 2 protein, partial [Candidatus Sulfotelmatobacter sp.]